MFFHSSYFGINFLKKQQDELKYGPLYSKKSWEEQF